MPVYYSQSHAMCSKQMACMLFGITFATVLTAFNVALTMRNIHRIHSLLPAPRNYTWLADDRPMEVPVPFEPRLIPLADPAPAFSLRNDTEWGTLFPTVGVIHGGPTNRTFLVAMVHQLHCLDIIRVGYVTNDPAYYDHVEHCMRYLLQSVLCAADGTLEEDEFVLVDGEWLQSVDAWDIPHKCRDRTALTHYLLEHKASPRTRSKDTV